MGKTRIAIALVTWAAIAQSVKASNFDITDWNLQNLVGCLGCNPPIAVGQPNHTVQNPFVAPIVFNHQNSTVNAQYSYIWNDSTGQFNVIANLTGQGGHFYQSSSNNSILITANADLLLSASGHFSYQVPAELGRQAGFSAGVVLIPGSSVVISQGFNINTSAGNPSSGSFDISFSQILPQLPVGQRYRLDSGFSLLSDTSGTALGFANGFINFSLTPVPEPAVLSLLLIGAPLVIVRRRAAARRLDWTS